MRYSIIFMFLLFSSLSFSQEPIKWGKPTKDEKALIACNFDSTANAVILSENGSIDFNSGYAYIHIYRKIKILNETGIQYSNIQIPFYHKDNLEEVKDIKAQTINNYQGNASITELNKNDIYSKIHNSRWSEIRFTFPSVREGSILEYKYTLVTKRITFLDAWIFQHEIPTLFSKIKVDIPSTLKYSIIFFGDKLMSKYNGKENTDNSWVLNNIPGYESEENVFCYEDYVEKIQFQLLSYEAWEEGGYSKGIYTVDVLKNWDKLAEELYEKYKLYLNRSNKAKDILDTLFKVSDSKEDKIRKIYKFINSFVSWDKDFYIFNDKSISELLESRRGNSAEINLFLCLLLNEAGISSYPVIISTKSHGKITKNYPLLEQFNHLIVGIKNDESFKFIDATSTSENYNIIPFEDYNYYGFILDKSIGKWIDIKNQTDSKENRTIILKFDSTKILLQEVHKYYGYKALNRKVELKENKNKKTGIVNYLANVSFKEDSSNVQNLYNDYSDFSETYFYSVQFKYGDKIYLNLNPMDLSNPFKQKERMFPIELDYTYSKQTLYSIIIPNGYIPKVIPKPIAIALPNNAGRFSYNISFSGNQMAIRFKEEIFLPIMPKDYYFYLKEFYNQIITKLNEPIIIEKEL